MSMYYKKVILLTCLIAGFSMFSQVKLKKQVKETFNMTNAGELYIDNKYGDVTINGWEENSISVVIDIVVTNKKKDNAKSLLERIVPRIKSTTDFIEIVSEISEKRTSVFSRYFNKVNPFDFDKSNVDINYTIYMPTHAEINVINKFGDVVLDNWKGKLKANIQHGDLWINESLTNGNVDIKYGSLRAKSLDYATVYIKNGRFDADSSKKLVLKSDGSTVDLLKVESLELYSSKDKINIKHINNLDGELHFTNMVIDTINSSVNLDMKIAELRVNSIKEVDAKVIIAQESSEISININGISFEFNAILEQGVLRLPKTSNNVNTELLDKGKRIRKISASYGDSLKGEFNLKGRKGIITLKE